MPDSTRFSRLLSEVSGGAVAEGDFFAPRPKPPTTRITALRLYLARAVSLLSNRHRMNVNDWLPKSVLCLKDYNSKKFSSDVVAGITVGLVALPLAMAFAIASGVPPQAGLYTAIVAGFLISALGGSTTQIGGPTGAFAHLGRCARTARAPHEAGRVRAARRHRKHLSQRGRGAGTGQGASHHHGSAKREPGLTETKKVRCGRSGGPASVPSRGSKSG